MAEGGTCGHTHHFPEYSQYLMEQLAVQKYYAAFCDVIVRVEDVDFRLHKCVLAAASSKLQSMLYNMRQECGNVLTLEDISLNGFRVLTEFMYTGVLKVEGSFMQDVLAAAQCLDLREVEKVCLDIMTNSGGDALHLRALAFASSASVEGPPAQCASVPPLSTEGSPTNTSVQQGMSSSNSTPAVINVAPPLTSHTEQQGSVSSAPETSGANTSLSLSQLQPQTFVGPMAGMSVDTNYIEDYLKLIESLQGDPTSQTPGKTDRSDVTLPPGNDSSTRNDSCITNQPASSGSMNYTQSGHKKSISSCRLLGEGGRLLGDSGRLLGDGGRLLGDGGRLLGDGGRLLGDQSRPAVPANLYSADEVRRTILSVLSQEKFEEEADPPGCCPPGYDRDSVPLTALLNLDPPPGEGNGEGSNSSDSDNSDGNDPDYQAESDRESRSYTTKRSRNKREKSAELGEETSNVKPAKSKQKRKIKTPVRVYRKSDVTCSDTEGKVNEVVQVKKKNKKIKKLKDPVIKIEKIDEMDLSFTHQDGIKTKPLKKRLNLKKRERYCEKCGRVFFKQESLDKHMELHDLDALHSCHVCYQKFGRACELTRHLRSHSADIFKCPFCELEYTEPSAYKQHVVSVHKETKAFFCQAPGCKFRSNKLCNVEKHAVIHTDIKTFQCHRCGKKFAQANGLRSHVRSCFEQRSYLCDICGAKFNHLQSMKSHRLLHTGEKPHQCHDCGAKFTDQRNFKRHRRIHENIFPYPCNLCNKKFRHSNSLKAHLQTHLKQMGTAGLDIQLDNNFQSENISVTGNT